MEDPAAVPQEGPSFMDTFHQVPELLFACKRGLLLHELRSLCTSTRNAATLLISRLMADVNEPSFSEVLESLPSLLQKCSKIHCLRVDLFFTQSRSLESDLENLVSTWGSSLEDVTSLEITLAMGGISSDGLLIQLQSAANEDECNELAGTMPATAIRVLAPACGPLTSLAVTGELPYGTADIRPTLTFLPILQSMAAASVNLTLKSLTFSLAMADPGTMIGIRPSSPDRDCGGIYIFQTSLSGDRWNGGVETEQDTEEACSLMSGCEVLTELSFGGVSVGGKGWSALPSGLKKLTVYRLDDMAPRNLGMPQLKQLDLNTSSLPSLLLLLHDVPDELALNARWVTTQECSEKILSDLLYAVSHPALRFQQQQSLEGNIPTRLSGVKGLCLHECFPFKIAMWDFVPMLPVIATVTDCHISTCCQLPEDAGFDIGLECLRYLPRVLPNLKHLTFNAFDTYPHPLTDKAVASLAPLKFLKRLKVVSRYGVSRDRVEAWGRMFPVVVAFEVKVLD